MITVTPPIPDPMPTLIDRFIIQDEKGNIAGEILWGLVGSGIQAYRAYYFLPDPKWSGGGVRTMRLIVDALDRANKFQRVYA